MFEVVSTNFGAGSARDLNFSILLLFRFLALNFVVSNEHCRLKAAKKSIHCCAIFSLGHRKCNLMVAFLNNNNNRLRFKWKRRIRTHSRRACPWNIFFYLFRDECVMRVYDTNTNSMCIRDHCNVDLCVEIKIRLHNFLLFYVWLTGGSLHHHQCELNLNSEP